MDDWVDYEGEVTRHEDLFPEDNASPEEEAVPPTESDPVTDDHTETQDRKASFSLRVNLTNKTGMKNKGKINFRFNTRRGLASGTTRAIRGAPEGLSRQEVLFGGLKSPNTALRGNLVVINISLFRFFIYFFLIIFTFPNCMFSYTLFLHRKRK
jgi:hypothetical protein